MSRTGPSHVALCVELAKAWGAAVEDHGEINPLPQFLASRLEAQAQAAEIACQAVGRDGPGPKAPRL